MSTLAQALKWKAKALSEVRLHDQEKTKKNIAPTQIC